MGRQTKAQQQRKAQRKSEPPAANPQVKSQMPASAKKPLRPTIGPPRRSIVQPFPVAVAPVDVRAPLPLLEQLERLGVPIALVHNVKGNPTYDTVVMRVTDLQKADQKIAEVWGSSGTPTQG